MGWDAWMHGIVTGGGVGLDYFFHKNVAVGAEFHVYYSWFIEYCHVNPSHTTGYTTCREVTDLQRLDIGLWWSVGLVFTAWFGA